MKEKNITAIFKEVLSQWQKLYGDTNSLLWYKRGQGLYMHTYSMVGGNEAVPVFPCSITA